MSQQTYFPRVPTVRSRVDGIFDLDCANNELYSYCLHIVTVCACAEVEVHTLSKRWQHPMAEIPGGGHITRGDHFAPLSPMLDSGHLLHVVPRPTDNNNKQVCEIYVAYAVGPTSL